MNFSTDVFLSTLEKHLSTIANDFICDMANDANIIARRLTDELDNEKALAHMNEIGTLAEMCTNMKHDCNALFKAFEGMFRREHGSGKHAATGLDAMKIITEISKDIYKVAPHLDWLFEDEEHVYNIIQNTYNSSFIEERTTFEIPAE